MSSLKLTLQSAIEFAVFKHASQVRKDSSKSIPYVFHTIDAANFLIKNGVIDLNTLAAAVLHDVLEDTFTSVLELKSLFGEKIASIVIECTDDKTLDKVVRKQLQLSHVANASNEAKLVKLADKWSNCSYGRANHWSDQEARGYNHWSWAVCVAAKGVNEQVDKEVAQLFQKIGVAVDTLTENQLQEELKTYYEFLTDNNEKESKQTKEKIDLASNLKFEIRNHQPLVNSCEMCGAIIVNTACDYCNQLDDASVKFYSFLNELIVLSRKTAYASDFLEPASKVAKGYDQVIANPMDLTRLGENIAAKKYNSTSQFLADVRLIYSNSLQYNGENSIVTTKAAYLVDFIEEKINEIRL